MPKRLSRGFFKRSVHEVAPELIGATLLFKGVGGRIVEVEAYRHTDPAAHSYGGPTARNAVMFGPPGYRLCLPLLRHPLVSEFCLRAQGFSQRRAAPCDRADRRPSGHAPAARRSKRTGCSAQARAGYARRSASRLPITAWPLDEPPFELFARSGDVEVVAGPRIGLTKAVDYPWRYGLKGSPFLSKPFKTPI